MRIRGLWRTRRLLRRATNAFRSGVAILMYHRVCDATTDPYNTCVSLAHFNEHMEHLRRRYTVLNLRKLTELLAAGRLPKRAVVLTLDDGYADNLWNARPILERWDLPATFFVTTGLMGGSREFWWDELSRLLLEAGSLPGTLHVKFKGGIFDWELGDSATYTDEDCRRHNTWKAKGTDDPTPRHALHRSLGKVLKPLPTTEKQHILDQLFTWANASPEGRPIHRIMTPDELISVEEGGLVEIGAHSVTHPVLSPLPAAAQRDEITRCKVELEEILGHTVSNFAYPHGCYNAETAALVRSAAFTSACTVVERLVRRDADPFQLPRFEMSDCNGDEFCRRLQEHMNYSYG